MEDPSEDVKEDAKEGERATEANDSAMKATLDETEATEATEALPKHDYSLLDMLCGFLYEDEDPLPILTGYFLKVMDQLLEKQKMMTLEYLLIHQEGKIFSGLLRHLDHHSVATVLIKLIEQ